jgi:hypothetical protein
MDVKPINNKPSFGILKYYRETPDSKYMVGIYKDKRIEIFDVPSENQKLQYVSDAKTLKWIKSKLKYIQDGITKITRSSSNGL